MVEFKVRHAANMAAMPPVRKKRLQTGYSRLQMAMIGMRKRIRHADHPEPDRREKRSKENVKIKG